LILYTDLTWKILHRVINKTISDMLDEQQSIDVLSLRARLHELAEKEEDEVMVLCYWQASKILLRLPTTVTASQLMVAARHAFRTPMDHDRL
jgi:helix-turn-helix protein